LVIGRAEGVARSVGDVRVAVLARLAADQVSLTDDVTVSPDELRSRALEAIETFLTLGDDEGLARAYHMVGEAFWLEARVADAEHAFVRAVSHAERAGDEREVRENLAWFAVAAFQGPVAVEEGLRRCAEVLQRARGDRLIQSFAKQSEGALLAMRGEFDRAREAIREGRGVCQDFGWIAEAAATSQLSAYAEMLAGDLGSAERELLWGCQVLEGIGELGYLSTSAGMLGTVLARQDRLEEADRYIATSIETGSPGDNHTQTEWRIARAEVLARRGDITAAVRAATEAVERASRTDLPNIRGNALVLLASLQLRSGRMSDAASNARLALAEFERKGNVVSAARARELLAELT
jgi:tetratricopeptide (TPR) repeat protein